MNRLASSAIAQAAAVACRKSNSSSAAPISPPACRIAASRLSPPGGTGCRPGARPSRYLPIIAITRLTRLPRPLASSSSARAIIRSTVKSASPTRGTSRSSHQRTASVPYSAASAAGSAPEPDDLLIFRPPDVR